MNKKMKLRYRAALSLALSAVLFGMPAAAFSMSGSNAAEVRAETTKEGESETVESSVSGETESESPEDTKEPETEGGTENDSENADISGNGADAVCTCEKKCSSYEYDKDCGVCVSDYKDCKYKSPNVSIKINKPKGWYNDTAKVKFSVSDIAHTGNFRIAGIQAKVGQNGSWTDVTEDKELEISENCTVYVLVTDQKGNTYERSKAIRCFDTTKPTLNAAVSGGLLSVQVYDVDSGAKAVYVNGYEFTKLTNGALNIRLQQFDAGYENFTISAMDNAGNMSEVYQTRNPYYKDPADESDENPAARLPESAEATKPGNAAGTVTEHTKTDSDGNAVMQTPGGQDAQADGNAGKEESNGQSEQWKEFYTIQTATDKVFYLVIDRDGEEETVYFLTEITENDLLNATSGNNETLPKNSAALESAIPADESALPNNNSSLMKETGQTEDGAGETESMEETENTEETESAEEAKGQNPTASYILIGAVAALFIGGAYYFKVARRKKDGFLEDEDEDAEDTEEYENEDEEAGDGTDDFFDRDGE